MLEVTRHESSKFLFERHQHFVLRRSGSPHKYLELSDLRKQTWNSQRESQNPCCIDNPHTRKINETPASFLIAAPFRKLHLCTEGAFMEIPPGKALVAQRKCKVAWERMWELMRVLDGGVPRTAAAITSRHKLNLFLFAHNSCSKPRGPVVANHIHSGDVPLRLEKVSRGIVEQVEACLGWAWICKATQEGPLNNQTCFNHLTGPACFAIFF